MNMSIPAHPAAVGGRYPDSGQAGPIDVPVLRGSLVRLEPLRQDHVPDLKTDARNQRSRQAIERLGARFEGVLRNWSPSRVPGEEGKLRDTAMFSVTAAEWPSVRPALADRVGRARSLGTLIRYPPAL